MVRADFPLIPQHYTSSLYDVSELSDVPGPTVLLQKLDCLRAQGYLVRAELGEKALCQ